MANEFKGKNIVVTGAGEGTFDCHKKFKKKHFHLKNINHLQSSSRNCLDNDDFNINLYLLLGLFRFGSRIDRTFVRARCHRLRRVIGDRAIARIAKIVPNHQNYRIRLAWLARNSWQSQSIFERRQSRWIGQQCRSDNLQAIFGVHRKRLRFVSRFTLNLKLSLQKNKKTCDFLFLILRQLCCFIHIYQQRNGHQRQISVQRDANRLAVHEWRRQYRQLVISGRKTCLRRTRSLFWIKICCWWFLPCIGSWIGRSEHSCEHRLSNSRHDRYGSHGMGWSSQSQRFDQ